MRKLRVRVPSWDRWRLLGATAGAAAIALCTLCVHLGSLAPRLSPGEQATAGAARQWHSILADPQHAPFKLLTYLANLALPHWPLLAARLPAVLLGAASLTIFLYIMHRWYGRRTMVFGFALLLCAAWFLHISRFAGVEVEYMAAVFALIAVHVGLYDHDDSLPMIFGWMAVNLLLLFIPGMVWLVMLNTALQWRGVLHAWQQLSLWWRVATAALVAAGVGGIADTIVRTPSLWTGWLGWPDRLPAWHTVLRQLWGTLTAVVYQGPHDPALWLGRLPLLDAFTICMFLAGSIFYATHWRAGRTQLLAAYFLLGVVLAGLGGPVGISVLVPIIYIVAAGGIAYVLHFWLRTFPRNILARGTGIVIVSLVLGLSCFYNLKQYFIAWPVNPEVTAVYRRPAP